MYVEGGGMNYSYSFLALNPNSDASFFKYLSDKLSVLTLLVPGSVLHKIKLLGLRQSQNAQSTSEFCLTSHHFGTV